MPALCLRLGLGLEDHCLGLRLCLVPILVSCLNTKTVSRHRPLFIGNVRYFNRTDVLTAVLLSEEPHCLTDAGDSEFVFTTAALLDPSNCMVMKVTVLSWSWC